MGRPVIAARIDVIRSVIMIIVVVCITVSKLKEVI